MIDMPATELQCVYSTMKYVEGCAIRNNTIPVCTFDQALYWKALQVKQSPSSDLGQFVIRLCPFHTIMNFLGVIGYIMAGSGLFDAFECIYAANTVPHLLSGKAVNRALRAHQLVDTCLSEILLKQAITIGSDEVIELKSLAEKTLSGVCETNFDENVILLRVSEALGKRKLAVKDGRTAQLWIQYTYLVDILRRFIRAERLEDWQLHLSTLEEMLPWFAASGHFLYAKTAWVYLQDMSQLRINHPSVYENFLNGAHVVWNQKSFMWNCMETDKSIEYFLMKTVKGTGGLFGGTGFDTVQRNRYLFSRPACAEISTAIEALTDVCHRFSQQHKQLSFSRIERDYTDRVLIKTAHPPFSNTTGTLCNIFSDVKASEFVDFDQAQGIGSSILADMLSKEVGDYKFSASKKAKHLAMKMKLTQKGNEVEVDPSLLSKIVCYITQWAT